jgi:hypothetical protein
MEIKNTGFLNPYEGLKQKYASNAIVNKYRDDWNIFANQGKLDEYLGTIDMFEQKGGTLSGLETEYKPDFLSSQERLLAMANEAVGDREKLVKKKREVVDEATQQLKEEEYETTDYQYTKDLLKTIADERELAYAKQMRNDTVTAKDVGLSVAGFFTSAAQGILTELNDVYNIFEGVAKGFDEWVKTGDYKQFDKGYRSAFTNDTWIDTASEVLQSVVIDPETGDYVTKAARYLYSAGESFGRMVPSMILQSIGGGVANHASSAGKAAALVGKGGSLIAKSGQAFYYTAMASSNLKESFNNSELCTRPTLELMANAAIKTGFEYGVERLLGKAFGATAIDSMAFGYVKAASKIGKGSAIIRILKDAIQEGTEEYLQDFSSYMVDRVFGLWAEDYKLASEWNMQVATDAFVMGALMSLAGSSFKVFVTTKNVDTGIAKTDKKGNVKYDKNGEVKTKKLGKLASYEYYTNFDKLTSDMSNYIRNEKLTREERTELMAGMLTTVKTLTDVFGEMGEERYRKAAQMLDAISQVETKAEQYRLYQDIEKQEILGSRKYAKTKYKSGEYAQDGKSVYEQMRAEYLSGREYIVSPDEERKASIFEYANAAPTDKRYNYADAIAAQRKGLRSSKPAMDESLLRARVNDYVAANLLMSKAELQAKAAEFVDTVKKFSDKKLTKAALKHLELKKDKIAENRITTPIVTINKEDTEVDTDNLTEKDIEVVKSVFGTSKYKSIIVSEDGVSPLEVDSTTIIVPANNLSQGANGIYKTLAETKIVEECNTYQPLRLVVKTITEIYRKNFNDVNATSETAVRRFLYDANFASTILFGKGDKDMVQFISVLNNIINNTASDTAADAIYKKELQDRQADLKRVFKKYVTQQTYVDYMSLSIFTAEEKTEIKNERYGLDFYLRTTKSGYKPSEHLDDGRMFAQRVNALPRITVDQKEKLVQDFYGSDIERASAINKVNRYYDYIWTSKYNGVIYMPMDNLKNTTFNSWLNSMGITIRELTKVNGISDDVRSNIESQYGSVNTKTLLNYYQESFEMFTRKDTDSAPAYTFEYDETAKEGSKVTVKEITTQKMQPVVGDAKQYIRKEQHHMQDDKLVYKPSGDAPKFDIFDKTKYSKAVRDTMTFDTAIRDVSTLSEDIQQDIKQKFGSLTSTNAYLYLNNKLMTETNNKFGLVLAGDGAVVVVDLVPFKEAVTDNFDKYIEGIVDGKYTGKSAKLSALFKDSYLNNLTKDTRVYAIDEFSSEYDHTTKAYYDEDINEITLFLPAIKSISPKNELNVYYEQALKNTLLHEYLHAVQKGNRLVNGGDPDIFLSFSDEAKDAIVADIKKHMPEVADRIKRYGYSKEETYNYISQVIYFGMGGEASSFGYGFKLSSYAPWLARESYGDTTFVSPWGSEYSEEGVVVKSKISKMAVDEDISNDLKDVKELTGKEFGQAMNQKAGKTKRVKSEGRSFTFKEEASQSNMKYLWDAAHKKGKPYVLTDTRIKDMIVATTGIEDELDPEFMNRVKDGRMSTVSDILEYMRSYEQLTPKVKTTVELINKYWFKNDYIKNATTLESMAVKGAAMLYATRSAIRQLIANEPELAEKLGLVEGLVKPMPPKDLMTVIARLSKIPQFKARYQQVLDGYEMVGKRSIDVDTNAMRIALLNNFDGTIQSAAAVASWARSLAINQKLRDSSISLDSESDSKDGGSRSLSETIADANAEMSHELGEVWFNEIANTSREERENLVFENRRNEYIAKLQESSKEALLKDIRTIQKTLSSDTDEEGNWISPLRQEVADMSDDDLNTAYLAYEYSAGIDFAELRNQIADQLIDAKGGTAERPRYKIVQRVKYLADKIKRLLTPDELKTFTEEYPELTYNDNGSYVLPREDIGDGKTTAISIEKVLELEELFDELAKKAYAIKTARQRFLTAEDALAKAKETIKGLKAKVKAEREATKAAKAQAKLVYAKVRNNVEIAIVSETNVPDKLNVLLSTNFDKLADTKVKYLTTEGQQHTIKSLAKFTEDNAEILASMTNAEAKEFVSFFKNSTVITDGANTETVTTYNAVRLYTLAYIYKNATGEYSQFQLTADEMKAIEDMVLTRASSAGTEMSISRQVLEEFKPAEYIIKKLSTEVNIDFSEETINELAELTSKFSNKDFAKMSEADVKAATLENIAALKKVFQKMYDEGLAKYKDTHKFSVFNQLWKFQRMAMLSSPGTWLRNITSNCIITAANKASAVIGDATFKVLQKAENKFSKTKVAPRPTRNLTDAQKANVHFAENRFGYNGKLTSQEALDNNYELVMQRIDKQITAQNNFARSVIAAVKARYNPELLQKLQDTKAALQLDHEYRIADLEYKQNVADKVNVRRTMYGQYQITGTVIAEDAKTFVNDYILDSGFYDMISESINKYTAGDFTRTAKANENLAQMIVASIQSEIFNDESFKVPNWWKKISKAGDDASGLNMWNKIIYKAISDDPWVKKAFASYLGKILTEDDVNLTKGITKEVQAHIVDAYKMAAWDYMHKTNAFSAVEKTIRQYTTEGGYFIWKQLFPFAVSGWNWFKEGLNYTPLGLAKAILDYAKLDKKVAKMSDDAAKGMGPSERFAGYIVKRNIGKGTIGTIGFIAGALLAGFGVAGIDEEDDKIKLRVGNVYIDISQLFGTQGILLGMVFANFFAEDGVIAKSQGDKGFDIFMRCVGSFLDQVFLDSTFSDLYSTISYTQTFSDVLVDMTDNMLSSFIPNFLKVVNNATYNHKVKYSKGFLGMLERKVVQTVPGIAYAYPKQYDVYTGEIKWQYGSGWWGIFQKVANSALPIKVYPYSVSDIEKEAILNGVNKGQLTGNYDNIKPFTPAQVSKLNEYYGQLNSADLAELKANKKKYKVKDEKTGKYVELTYSKMTAKQKNNVISRIMEDNAEIAKIYVYTSSGGKYYAETETAFQTLRSLRIKNVFRATGSKKGFN